MDPTTIQAAAGLLGGMAGASTTSGVGPQWLAMNFGSYGSISSPGVFTGTAAAGGIGGPGGMPGWLLAAGGVALVWVLLKKRGR